MGNGCFCITGNYIRDINLSSSNKQPTLNITNELIVQEEKDNNLKIKLNNLMQYFEDTEKEIINDLKKKEKSKKHNNRKKSSNKFETIINNNIYEIMVEKLLSQQNAKKCGPKRRETNRNGENIKAIVLEILKENKDNIKNIKETMNKKSSLIIKNTKDIKGRLSVEILRSGILTNKIAKNKV